MTKRKVILLALTVIAMIFVAFCVSSCQKDEPALKKYKVWFMAGGEQYYIEVEEGNSLVGHKINKEQMPSKEGYNFLGLFDAEEGGIKYVNSDGIGVASISITKDLWLYSQFEEKSVTISFDCENSNIQTPSNIVVPYSSNMPSLPSDLEHKENAKYYFDGWYTEANCKGTKVATNNGISNMKVADLCRTQDTIILYAGFKVNTYTVSFYDCKNFSNWWMDYENTPIENKTVEYGALLKDIAPKTRTSGHKILSWSLSPNSFECSADEKITANRDFYVYSYEITVTYDTAGGSKVENAVGSNRQQFAMLNTLSKKEHYRLEKWLDKDGNLATGYFSDNATVTAQWKNTYFAVTYVTDGKESKVNYEENNNVSLAAKTKDYYKFVGWKYEDKTLTCDQTLKMPSKDITLTAVWEQTHFEVNYNDDGNITTEHIKIAENVPLRTLTKNYYEFIGWKYQEETYGADKTLKMPKENITLTAVWVQTHYIVKYVNGGDVTNSYVKIGESVVFTVPTKRCYSFNGWKYQDKVYNQGDEFKMPAENVIFTALWELSAYWVTFDGNDGKEVKIGQSTTLPNPSKTGHTFDGWVYGGQKYKDTFKPESDADLRSTFTANSYKVNLDADGDGTYESYQMVTYGLRYTLPIPTKEEHIFLGWFGVRDEPFTNASGSSYEVYSATDQAHFIAHWQIKEYVLHLDPKGGSVSPSTGKASFGRSYTLPIPTREGYTFTGWYALHGDKWVNEFGRSIVDYPSKCDGELVAGWQIRTFRIYRENDTNGQHVKLNFGNKGDLNDTNKSLEYEYNAEVRFTYGFDTCWGWPNTGVPFVLSNKNTNQGVICSEEPNDKRVFLMPAFDVLIKTKSDGKLICFVNGTMITIGNNEEKPIEELSVGDKVLSWNFTTGTAEYQPIIYYYKHEAEEVSVVNLEFSNGNNLRIVGTHGIFDISERKFVYVDDSNYRALIGHSFASVYNDETTAVKLVNAYITNENISWYSLLTATNGNAVADSLLTMKSEEYVEVFMPFDVGENLKYDEVKMQAEIEKYGLYTYEEWQDYVTIEEFYAFNVQYLKIAVSKGIMTREDLIDLAKRYILK